MANHEARVDTVTFPKYEGADLPFGESFPGPEPGKEHLSDWHGTMRAACLCGWRDSRVSTDGDVLAGHWREHVTAAAYELRLRR